MYVSGNTEKRLCRKYIRSLLQDEYLITKSCSRKDHPRNKRNINNGMDMETGKTLPINAQNKSTESVRETKDD